MASAEQVIKNIVRVLRNNPEKVIQLEKVQSISVHCTSDDHIRIVCELYRNHIVRYLISGTRSNMTITYFTDTNTITRKPRGENPWYVDEVQCWCSDILKRV